MKTKTILLTGTSGFIGKIFLKNALYNGYNVLDILRIKNKKNKKLKSLKRKYNQTYNSIFYSKVEEINNKLKNKKIDYFPSYEIATNPRLHSTSFEANLRSIRYETVDMVMQHFFSEHPPINKHRRATNNENEALKREVIQCEEAIMENFAQ